MNGLANPARAARLRIYATEAIGTFALVFAGCGAMVVDDVTGGAVSHVGVALTWGLIVMAMIYAIGDISGAHINPAVTVAFFAARRLRARLVLPYIVSQCLGAIAAAALLRVLFPAAQTLGQTLPADAPMQALGLEIMLTAMLVFVILSVSTGAKEKGMMAGIAVGGTVGLEAMFAGPISGASMNPARSLGPALVAWDWTALWVYMLAPLLGALAAVACCRLTHCADDCCVPAETARDAPACDDA